MSFGNPETQCVTFLLKPSNLHICRPKDVEFLHTAENLSQLTEKLHVALFEFFDLKVENSSGCLSGHDFDEQISGGKTCRESVVEFVLYLLQFLRDDGLNCEARVGMEPFVKPFIRPCNNLLSFFQRQLFSFVVKVNQV